MLQHLDLHETGETRVKINYSKRDPHNLVADKASARDADVDAAGKQRNRRVDRLEGWRVGTR
jgi:hypothetical protein